MNALSNVGMRGIGRAAAVGACRAARAGLQGPLRVPDYVSVDGVVEASRRVEGVMYEEWKASLL